jgi:hypothetical protein
MSYAMARGVFLAVPVLALILSQASAAGTGDQKDVRYDDPKFCSEALAAGSPALSTEMHKQCVIAVASTYLAAEQNSLPPEQVPFADDVARHVLATPAVFAPGNRAKVVAALNQSIVGGIKDRQWAVESDQAWVVYDGYLETNPTPTKFPLAERITVEKGMIKEIVVIVAAGAQ